MSAQPVDYEALAKQAGAVSSTPPSGGRGGGVDYAALAKQAGAVSSTPAVDSPAQMKYGTGPNSTGTAYSRKTHQLQQPADLKAIEEANRPKRMERATGKFGEQHPVLASPVDFLQGVGTGPLTLARGVSQIAHHLVPSIPEIPAEYSEPPDSNVAKAGNLVGQVLTPGVPEIEAATTGGKIGVAALQGAVAAGSQPVDDGQNFWEEKGKQVGTGAVVGPLAAGAASLVGKGVSKLMNSRAGNIPEEAAGLMEAGKKHGVRLTYGDITRNPSVQKAEVAMENVPVVGMSGERAAQQSEAKGAAQSIVSSRYDKFLDTDPGLIGDIQHAADGGDARANHLLDQLQHAGNDPDKILQTSIGLGDFRTRQEAEHLYDRVGELVKKHNLPDVPLGGTSQAVSQALAEAEGSKLPDRQLIGILRDIKSGISPKAAARPANPFPVGTVAAKEFDRKSAASIPAQNDYESIRQLRSDLGNKIQTYMSGENGIIGEKGVGQLQRVKSAIEGDLSAFTENSGVSEVQQAAKTADAYYKTARVPYKDAMLSAAAADKEPDQIFQRFIQAGKGDRAQRFYDSLDPKGQEAVRYKIVSTAVEKATNDTTGTFSPQKYFTAMNKLDDAAGVFFKGADRAEIEGFNNLMAHVTRAGQYAENPPTGQRMVSGMVTAGAIVQPVMAAKVGAVVLAAKTLFTTDRGKSFLLAASKFPPGSLRMRALIRQMPSIASRVANQLRGSQDGK